MKTFIRLTIIILAVITVVSQGAVIFISNTAAADSITATEVSNKIQRVEEENIDIQSKILSYASYDKISSRAAELGYLPTRDFVSVYTPLPVAFGR